MNLTRLSAALALLFWAQVTTAQDDDFSTESTSDGVATLQHGDGLQIRFPGDGFVLGIGGLAQPGLQWTAMDADSTGTLGTYVRRSYLTIEATDEERRLDFLLRADFSQALPLLDAYVQWRASEHLTLRAGQFQQIANNREMLFYEGALNFPNRSLLSETFAGLGREFGLAVMGEWGAADGLLVRPAVSVTSGDGANSFGSLSNDPDLGGLKWSGRFDVLPFGDFDVESAVDFQREEQPKVAIGLATSYNIGASGAVGESHGDWYIYDEAGRHQLPNYLKNHVDLLVKWRGATLLAEYVNAAAYGLDGAFTDASLGTLLLPTQISTYLMLGNAFNVQAGYALPNGWAIDARLARTYPEFAADNANSLLQVADAFGGCVTWYRNEQALKIQLAADYFNYPDVPVANGWRASVQTQFLF